MIKTLRTTQALEPDDAELLVLCDRVTKLSYTRMHDAGTGKSTQHRMATEHYQKINIVVKVRFRF